MPLPILGTIAPEVGAALVNILGGLFGSVLSGKGKEEEYKRQKELLAEERAYRERRGQEMLGLLKPQVPYYQSPYLSSVDRVLHAAILGNLAERFGKSDFLSKYGINIQDVLKNMGLLGGNQTISVPPGSSTFQPIPFQNRGFQLPSARNNFPGREILLSKYGLGQEMEDRYGLSRPLR